MTWFGQCDSSGNPAGGALGDVNSLGGNQSWWHVGKSYTCPGSGNQVISELSCYVKINSGTPSIRLGLYNSSGSLVCQGAAAVALSGSSYSWQGHMSQAALTPNPYNLTGGATYRFGISGSGPETGVRSTPDGATGDTHYATSSYTSGGWPASIPSGTGYHYWIVWRANVNPPASGALPPHILRPYHNRYLVVR